MQSMSTASGDSLSFSYDAIKRLSSMQAGSRYTKAYTYRTISGSQSSTQISALRYSGFSNAPTYHYTYTANGSIASQWENSNSPATFQYDTLGQLTEATLLTEDLTYFYSYDDAGNLLQVSVSGFAHGSDDYVNTYSYSNADWPDLLTAFNGQPIVYEGQTYALLTHIATGVSTVSTSEAPSGAAIPSAITTAPVGPSSGKTAGGSPPPPIPIPPCSSPTTSTDTGPPRR